MLLMIPMMTNSHEHDNDTDDGNDPKDGSCIHVLLVLLWVLVLLFLIISLSFLGPAAACLAGKESVKQLFQLDTN